MSYPLGLGGIASSPGLYPAPGHIVMVDFSLVLIVDHGDPGTRRVFIHVFSTLNKRNGPHTNSGECGTKRSCGRPTFLSTLLPVCKEVRIFAWGLT